MRGRGGRFPGCRSSLRAPASRTWLGNMLQEYLRFISTNTFHLNGDPRHFGDSGFDYKPVTLEAGFASAAALMEMLLQSWGGKIRVFPAVPEFWPACLFRKAAGGRGVPGYGAAGERPNPIRRDRERSGRDLQSEEPLSRQRGEPGPIMAAESRCWRASGSSSRRRRGTSTC